MIAAVLLLLNVYLSVFALYVKNPVCMLLIRDATPILGTSTFAFIVNIYTVDSRYLEVEGTR